MENVITITLLIIITAVSITAICFSVNVAIKLEEMKKRLDIFLQGKDAESLEDFFIDMQNNLDILTDDNKKNIENIKKINKIIKKTFQKVGLYKYDALDEKSGKRSFALAILDFTNTGIIITNQVVGDNTIVFIKEIESGTTSIKLGPEEQKALEIAMGQRKKYED